LTIYFKGVADHIRPAAYSLRWSLFYRTQLA